MDYPHLGLNRWPFPVVPQPEFCDFMADRKQLSGDIDSLLTALHRQSASSIHLIWSWFGAGKTHTLYYMMYLASTMNDDRGRLHTVYSEFPKAPTSFVDVFRSFAQGLDYDEIIDAYLEISTGPTADSFNRTMARASPDLITALRVLAMGTASDQLTALRWLRGDSLPLAEFRKIGIAQRITTSEEATRVLAAIAALFTLAARSRGSGESRIVWFLDEYQRINFLPKRIVAEISSGLHSVFNATPTGLSIMLSFSGRPEKSLPSWLTPELRDRIARTKVLVLPPMHTSEGLIFVRDVLERFRSSDYGAIQNPYFPFTEDSSRTVLEIIERHEELKPRSIMLAFGAVLQEAEPLIESGRIDSISTQFAARVLDDYVPTEPLEE